MSPALPATRRRWTAPGRNIRWKPATGRRGAAVSPTPSISSAGIIRRLPTRSASPATTLTTFISPIISAGRLTAAAIAATPACRTTREPPNRWLAITPRSCGSAAANCGAGTDVGATLLVRLRLLAARTLRRRTGESRPCAMLSVIRHALMRGVLLIELDDRLHLRQHVIRQPAQAHMTIAEVLYRRHLRLAKIVRHQLLVAAACLERTAGRRVHRRRD